MYVQAQFVGPLTVLWAVGFAFCPSVASEEVGRIVAPRRSVVVPGVSRRIVEMRFEEGDAVVYQQVLTRLEDAEYRSDVIHAQTLLEIAQIKYDELVKGGRS